MKNRPDFNQLYIKIVKKAWTDPNFKKRLLKDPKAAAKECGLDLPSHVKIKVVEAAHDEKVFVLPAQQFELEELSEEELRQLAAGGKSRACPDYPDPTM